MVDNVKSKLNGRLDAVDKNSASVADIVIDQAESYKEQSDILNSLRSGKETSVNGLLVNKLGIASVDGNVSGVENAVGNLSGTIEVPIEGDSDTAPPTTQVINVEDAVSNLVGGDAVKELTSKFVTLGGASFASINSAITGAVDTVTDAVYDGVKGIMDATGVSEGLSEDLVDAVSKESTKGNNALANKLNEIYIQQERVNDITTGDLVNTSNGIIQDFNETVNRFASSVLNPFGEGLPFDDSKISEIVQSTKGSSKDIAKSVKTLVETNVDVSVESKAILNSVKSYNDVGDYVSQYQTKASSANIPQSEIDKVSDKAKRAEEVLYQIDTSVTGNITSSSSDFYSGTKELSKLDYKFEPVASVEELIAEFSNLKREVTELVIHSSDTHTNQNIGSREIDTYHKEEGFNGIQFHYVIRRNGVIERGVPINNKGEASRINGHEEYSIDVCLVGGINAPTGTPNADNYFSQSSYTRAQMESFETLIWTWYNRMPGGVVLGYGDIDNQSEQPHFNVMDYVEDRFGKPRVFKDPSIEQPLTPNDLVKKRPV
jgi:N-acetylmuramoyl-L-alanine amidase